MPDAPDEMPADDYATFAAREMWLDIGREIGDHTLAATKMISAGMSALIDIVGRDEAQGIARAAIDAATSSEPDANP